MIKFYHNNRCSKSREALELLRETNEEIEVVEYLKTPPTAEELRQVLKLLGLKPQDVVRKGEALYKEKYKDKSL